MERKIIRNKFGRYCNGSNTSGMLGKHHSKETKEKLAILKNGFHTSPGTKFKKGHNYGIQTRFKKGHITWCKGKKGVMPTPWNKGKIIPEMSGENNPSKRIEVRKKISALQQGILLENWKKFVSREPYSQNFDNQFKKSIKERDNFTCLKCGLFEKDAIKLFKIGLHTHHINYDKKLTMKENCCVLCVRCHGEVNNNRNQWIKFFQSLLSERYGYQYNDNQEIFVNITKEVN